MAQQTNERKTFFKSIRGTKDDNDTAEMSFVEHLEALRWHLVRAVIVWFVALGFVFVKIDWIFDNIVYAPADSNFISYKWLCSFGHKINIGDALCMPPVKFPLQFTTVSGPFMSAISLSMVGSFIITFPYLAWELWRFVRPALSAKERKYSKGSIFWVSLCFFTGAAFGYFVLAPFTFNFLANFKIGEHAVTEYKPMMDDYIDTLNNLILGCGIAFELPVLSYVLAKIGLINAKFLRNYRKWAVVIILLLAAIITPSPDWTSQVIVAIPLLILYELSVWIVSRVDKNQEKIEASWE